MVYINDRHQFIFIENPKSGSTSVLKALSESLGIQIQRTPHLQNAHQTCDQLKELYPDKWERYFKVSTFRDPYKRWYSSINYPRHHNLRGIKSFHDLKNHLENPGTCQYCIPQKEFTKVDFIINTNNTQQDYTTFCEIVGIPSCTVKIINKNNTILYTADQLKELSLFATL